MLDPEEAGGVVVGAVGAVVVPVLVGVVVVLGVVLGLAPVVPVAGDTAPAAPVLGEGVVSVLVPPVSEPQPNNASAITAQTLTLRRAAGRDVKPFAWPLSVEFFRSKFMSSLQGPAVPK